VVAEDAPSPKKKGAKGDGGGASKQVRVECNGVMLKLTLSEAQLKKSFADAVLTPFLKAYSKKAGLYAGRLPTPADVASVEVDGVPLGDHGLGSGIVLLAREAVDVDVELKPPPAAAAPPQGLSQTLPDGPFGGPFGGPFDGGGAEASAREPPRPPEGGYVELDGKTDLERIKEQRRAARLAREAAGGGGDADVACEPLPPGSYVLVQGLASEAGRALNGTRGEVVSWLEEKQRYQLRGEGGQLVNLKRANLSLIGSGDAGPPAAAPDCSPSSAEAGDAVPVGERLLALERRTDSAGVALGGLSSSLARVDLDDVEAAAGCAVRRAPAEPPVRVQLVRR